MPPSTTTTSRLPPSSSTSPLCADSCAGGVPRAWKEPPWSRGSLEQRTLHPRPSPPLRFGPSPAVQPPSVRPPPTFLVPRGAVLQRARLPEGREADPSALAEAGGCQRERGSAGGSRAEVKLFAPRVKAGSG